MSVPQLPQEVINDIISRVDCLQQSSLALVCKAFRPQVQRLRFHQITLDDERPRRTDRLSSVLACNPTLSDHVHTVRLAYGWDSKINAERGQAPDILERVLQACQIHVLIFAYGTVPLQILQLLSPRNVPYLRSLRLSSASRTPMDALHDALSLLPPLNYLDLWTDYLYTEVAPWRDGREPLRVKKMHVGVGRAPTEDSWTLGSSYTVEDEVAISLYAPWASDCAGPINNVLQAWGSTPRRLRIDVSYGALREF
jgi:hypothetical protein